MSTTIVVTRNVPGRYRGFLASCMLEIAPGIYLSPSMKKAIRERVWDVMLDWEQVLPEDGGVVMFWPDRRAAGNLNMHVLGYPQKELIEYGGIWLAVGSITAQYDVEELEALAGKE